MIEKPLLYFMQEYHNKFVIEVETFTPFVSKYKQK